MQGLLNFMCSRCVEDIAVWLYSETIGYKNEQSTKLCKKSFCFFLLDELDYWLGIREGKAYRYKIF